MKKDVKLGREVGLDLGGAKGEYDQNALYEILKQNQTKTPKYLFKITRWKSEWRGHRRQTKEK